MFEVKAVDFSNSIDCKHFCELLNHYAMDPMGGGESLPIATLEKVCVDLRNWPGALSFMAFEKEHPDEPLRLINCFMAYSTFKAKPILNVHDIVVKRESRYQGVGRKMLTHIEEHAKKMGCCKLTLEVLTGNTQALNAYEAFGFERYQLQADKGHAVFLQKWMK